MFSPLPPGADPSLVPTSPLVDARKKESVGKRLLACHALLTQGTGNSQSISRWKTNSFHNEYFDCVTCASSPN